MPKSAEGSSQLNLSLLNNQSFYRYIISRNHSIEIDAFGKVSSVKVVNIITRVLCTIHHFYYWSSVQIVQNQFNFTRCGYAIINSCILIERIRIILTKVIGKLN